MTLEQPVDAPLAKTHGADGDQPATLLDMVPEYEKIDGWLKINEAETLFAAAASITSGCIVEVGSYRGRSTTALAAGSKVGNNVPVFAVEPHEHFVGVKGGAFGPNDRRAFYRTMLATKLFKVVRLLNTTSTVLAAGWDKPVTLLFIDADHRYESVFADFDAWRLFLVNDAMVIFNDAAGAGTAQAIKELVYEGCLKHVSSVGRLGVFRYLNASGDIDAGSIQHESSPAVYPALALDEEAPAQPGLTASTIGYGLYYPRHGRYLYQPIPKCGCTSIKTILLELEGLSIDPNEWRRHNKDLNNFPGTDNLAPKTQEDIYAGRTDTFKFVIVRDPYTRMASVYLDKILNAGKKRHMYWINQIKVAAKEQGVTLSEIITFDEFVRVASAQPVKEMDPHWRQQYYEGRFSIINFDFVGHVEMLTSDMIYVLERLQAPEALMHKAARPHNVTGSTLAMWGNVPSEARSAFVKTYAIDFDVFRYPFRYQYIW
jgi:predicted O-methyltransferase YrrM